MENQALLEKIAWRLLPFLFLMFAISFLDRINIGFAALSMNKDLRLTATAFGFVTTVFYVGYVLCEIPSNLLMARFGARVWLSRIMITWGLAASATMFVVDTASLAGARFLVGVFEAGFVPGVLLYLTYWFPDSHRARANGLLMLAQPFASAIGATVSGVILDRTDGLLGLAGWRWMYLLEGLPAVIVGIIAYFYLTDRPDKSRWLSNDEARSLELILEADRNKVARATVRPSIWSQITETKVVLLALSYFALVTTLNATSTWGPTIVRGVLHAYSLTQVGFVSALPPVCTIIAIPLWVWSSDRHKERIWHLSAALMLAAAGWLLVIFTTNAVGQMLGLCCATSGAFCAMAVFWTLPQKILSTEARPAGIGLINATGLFGSAVSAPVIGVLKDLTDSFAAGLFYATALLVISMSLAWVVTRMASPEPSAAG